MKFYRVEGDIKPRWFGDKQSAIDYAERHIGYFPHVKMRVAIRLHMFDETLKFDDVSDLVRLLNDEDDNGGEVVWQSRAATP